MRRNNQGEKTNNGKKTENEQINDRNIKKKRVIAGKVKMCKYKQSKK